MDKKELEMNGVNDFDWIRGLDAQGNSIKISKEDMVELMRETLGTVNSSAKGLMDYEKTLFYKGDVSNCNSIHSTGIFRCLSATANTPISVTAAGILISLQCYINGAYVFQLWFDLLGKTLYWRRKTDETWINWIALN